MTLEPPECGAGALKGRTASRARVTGTGCRAIIANGRDGKLPVGYVAQPGSDDVATAGVANACGHLRSEVGTGLAAAAIDAANLRVRRTAGIEAGRSIFAQQRGCRDVATRVTERKPDGHACHNDAPQHACGSDGT